MIPSTDDRFIRVGRFNSSVALLLIAAGVILVRIGLPKERPFWRELPLQVGFAAITAALIEVLALPGIERFKQDLTKRWREIDDEIRRSTTEIDEKIEQAKQWMEHVDQTVFRTNVQTSLDVIKLEIEQIRVAVDEDYRTIVFAAQREKEKGQG